MAFVRSGYVYPYGGSTNYVGNGGWVWSHTSRSSTGAYLLGMDYTDVGPSYYNNRYYGLPLRCLYQAKA